MEFFLPVLLCRRLLCTAARWPTTTELEHELSVAVACWLFTAAKLKRVQLGHTVELRPRSRGIMWRCLGTLAAKHSLLA